MSVVVRMRPDSPALIPMRRTTETYGVPDPAAGALRAYLRNFSERTFPTVSRFVLFGSFARGDHRDGSDIDLAVIFCGTPPGDRERVRIGRALQEPAFAVIVRDRISQLVSPVALWESEFGDGSAPPKMPFDRGGVT